MVVVGARNPLIKIHNSINNIVTGNHSSTPYRTQFESTLDGENKYWFDNGRVECTPKCTVASVAEIKCINPESRKHTKLNTFCARDPLSSPAHTRFCSSGRPSPNETRVLFKNHLLLSPDTNTSHFLIS